MAPLSRRWCEGDGRDSNPRPRACEAGPPSLDITRGLGTTSRVSPGSERRLIDGSCRFHLVLLVAMSPTAWNFVPGVGRWADVDGRWGLHLERHLFRSRAL